MLVDAVAGDGAFEQLVRAGLPLAPRDDGWHQLPGRVREELGDAERLESDVARRAAETYATAASGGRLGLLARAGEHEGVAALSRRSPWRRSPRSACRCSPATVATVPDEVLLDRPRTLLQVARAADQARRPAPRELLGPGGLGGADHATARELHAERAVDAYARRDYDPIEELAAECWRRGGARGRSSPAAARCEAGAVRRRSARTPPARPALRRPPPCSRRRARPAGGARPSACSAFRFRFHAGELETAARMMTEALAGMPGPR